MEQKCPQCGAPLPSGVLAGLCPACLMKQGAAADTAVPVDASAFQPPSVAEIAALFPQLQIIALLGRGGMGAVYQARQPALDRIVALKILPPQTAAGPGFIERFNREARALARLSHPNIVAVYEFGQVNGLPYFIMEYVDGLNLREIERAGKLSPREALQIVPQICDALQFAHDEGIVHRDIKPENILVDKKGRVKIADFGIAKILGAAPDVDLTQTKGALGTPHYMAPEQMEKPTAVDHRADIFSLGVVFYEMLTGELPLGKFAPPSSRKIEVDVRLDDVVLRALEKDPARRYQHASQVKTAVDTIMGSAPPPPPPPAANGAAMAQEILARDYTLSIRSCVRRGWNLLKSTFWPFVGITALILVLISMASTFGGVTLSRGTDGRDTVQTTSTLLMIVWGPMIGGLMLYFLKKARREPTTVETAFSGFSARFLHLFLASFVSGLLTWIGFLCLIVPGIYLMVVWMFTLPLVIDKGLDFWSAMELSRKVVTRHWFKLFGFSIVLLLLLFAGALMLGFGLFVMLPLALAAYIFAYEDIFGGAGKGAPAATGPTGTIVTPQASPQPATGAAMWSVGTIIGLVLVAVVVGLIAVTNVIHRNQERHAWMVRQQEVAEAARNAALSAPSDNNTSAPLIFFGQVFEQELTNLAAVKLASRQTDTLPQSLVEQIRGPEKDQAVCDWLESQDLDFTYLSPYDGFYGMNRDLVTLKREAWNDTSPQTLDELLHDTGKNVSARFGDTSRLNNPTNYTYGFKVSDGSIGLLQVVRYVENPPGVAIRFKLAAHEALANGGDSARAKSESLSARLEAASNINDYNSRDMALTIVAKDAASGGNVETAKKALSRMTDPNRRGEATRQAALLLAGRGAKRQAVDIAKGIDDFNLRDQTLGELAK